MSITCTFYPRTKASYIFYFCYTIFTLYISIYTFFFLFFHQFSLSLLFSHCRHLWFCFSSSSCEFSVFQRISFFLVEFLHFILLFIDIDFINFYFKRKGLWKRRWPKTNIKIAQQIEEQQQKHNYKTCENFNHNIELSLMTIETKWQPFSK